MHLPPRPLDVPLGREVIVSRVRGPEVIIDGQVAWPKRAGHRRAPHLPSTTPFDLFKPHPASTLCSPAPPADATIAAQQ